MKFDQSFLAPLLIGIVDAKRVQPVFSSASEGLGEVPSDCEDDVDAVVSIAEDINGYNWTTESEYNTLANEYREAVEEVRTCVEVECDPLLEEMNRTEAVLVQATALKNSTGIAYSQGLRDQRVVLQEQQVLVASANTAQETYDNYFRTLSEPTTPAQLAQLQLYREAAELARTLQVEHYNNHVLRHQNIVAILLQQKTDALNAWSAAGDAARRAEVEFDAQNCNEPRPWVGPPIISYTPPIYGRPGGINNGKDSATNPY